MDVINYIIIRENATINRIHPLSKLVNPVNCDFQFIPVNVGGHIYTD